MKIVLAVKHVTPFSPTTCWPSYMTTETVTQGADLILFPEKDT